MKRISLTYITYDGVLNTMCGVGALTRTFLESFPEVRERLLREGLEVSLNLLTVALAEGADGFCKNLLSNAKKVAKDSGGDVYYVLNDSEGDNQFGSHENWKVASISAATKVLEIAQAYDESLVYCIDTPFLHVPYYVNRQKISYFNQNIKNLLVLHSDVLVHHPDSPDQDRLKWEAAAIRFAEIYEDVYIAKTSEFLAQHLRKNYTINDRKIVDFQTGIYPADEKFRLRTKKEISSKLSEYDIPLDKKIIFSVGRAVEYKGFEILIDAFSKLNRDDTHLVFIASQYNDRFCNVEELKEIIKKKKVSCTPIFELDFELPSYIYQWEGTKIVAQLALHEPFGLVPEDVRAFPNIIGPVVLASSREGFLEQINDNEDGFLISVEDTTVVAKKLEEILNIEKEDIVRIRKNGHLRVLKNYDYRNSIINSILELRKDDCYIAMDVK